MRIRRDILNGKIYLELEKQGSSSEFLNKVTGETSAYNINGEIERVLQAWLTDD